MKQPNKRVFVLVGLVLAALAVGQGVAIADTMVTATGTGSATPPIVAGPQVNGSFTITPAPPASNSGDGVDDTTRWILDFKGDPGWATFPAGKPLQSAVLTLTLTPGHPLVSNDTVAIQGLPGISDPAIQGLPVGIANTVQIDLTDYYSSSQINGILTGGGFGEIPLVYQDDTIVSFAQLDLFVQGPPTGTNTYALGLVGLLGIGAGLLILVRGRRALIA